MSCSSVIPVLGMHSTQRFSAERGSREGVGALLLLEEEKWDQGHRGRVAGEEVTFTARILCGTERQ